MLRFSWRPARLSTWTGQVHYAWVTLGIAIGIRLVSSVERIASGVLVAYLVTPKPEGQFGWSHGAISILVLPLHFLPSVYQLGGVLTLGGPFIGAPQTGPSWRLNHPHLNPPPSLRPFPHRGGRDEGMGWPTRLP